MYNKIFCDKCNKEYSKKGIFTHMLRAHGTDTQKSAFRHVLCHNPANNKNKICKQNRVDQYNLLPSTCINCNGILSYDHRTNKFCSKSCSAKFNNSIIQRNKSGPSKGAVFLKKDGTPIVKTSCTTATREASINDIPYSSLVRCKCAHCGILWCGKVWSKYCKDHVELYSSNGRARFVFTFALSDYPQLFDFKLLEKYGMRGPNNPYGITRDHRVSINESDYDD